MVVRFAAVFRRTYQRFFFPIAISDDRIRISHVPNVALLLKAKERIKNNLLKPAKLPAAPPKTAAQTVSKGSSRLAHVPSEPPKPKVSKNFLIYSINKLNVL